MIRLPLPKARDGDVLGLGLINDMLKRIEYAADLLRQGRPLAGSNTIIREASLGSIINTSLFEDEETKAIYRIIGFLGDIYDPFTNTYSEVPNKTPLDRYYGIAGKNYFGAINPSQNEYRGIITQGEIRREILFGDFTQFFGGSDGFAVGEYYDLDDPGVPIFGVKCNLDGSGFTKIEYPNVVPVGIYSRQNMALLDIDDGNIIGSVTLFNTGGQQFGKDFLRLSSGQYIDLPQPPHKIYGDYITFTGSGQLYKISDATTKTILYNGQATKLYGIYKEFVNGFSIAFNVAFIYNIVSETFEVIDFTGEDMG